MNHARLHSLQRLRIRKFLIILVFPALLGVTTTEQWDITEQQVEKIGNRFGQDAKTRIHTWLNLIQSYKNASEKDKLEVVNHFFNKMRFVSDNEQWGINDYWATPVEFLIASGGDCEDFSMAKYFTLKAMGVPVERMRLTYVRALTPNPVSQAHMILSYFPSKDAEPLVLDNLVNDIRPASQRQDLTPVYSFNGDGLWLAKQRGQGQRVGDSSRLGLWSGVVQRMKGLWGKLIDE